MTKPGPKRTDPIVRWWRKVNDKAEGGCWLWTGSTNPRGYGSFWDGDRDAVAHRFGYEKLVGPIPEGLHIDHLCRVRNCVNPAHLEAVTQLENNRRQPNVIEQMARTHCPHGHAYTADNTADYGNGRICKTCNRQRAATYYQQKRKGADPRDDITPFELQADDADAGAYDGAA